MSSKFPSPDTHRSSSLCDEIVAVPMPLSLKDDLRKLADRDCQSLAASARRLLKHAIQRELGQLATVGEAR